MAAMVLSRFLPRVACCRGRARNLLLFRGFSTFTGSPDRPLPADGTSASISIPAATHRLISRPYEKWVAHKVKNPYAPRVRPSYVGNISVARAPDFTTPPEEDCMLVARIQIASFRGGPNFHFLGTAKIVNESVPGRKRGGRNEHRTWRNSEMTRKLVSIVNHVVRKKDIIDTARIIRSLPIYDDLEDIWQSQDGRHPEFIAREYLKHSSWSKSERLSPLQYCYMSLKLAHSLITGELNIQELLTLLKFFTGHIYKCSHMELKMSYALGVRVKGYYIPIDEDLMVKLHELILASSRKGKLVDYPEDYTSGLFLL